METIISPDKVVDRVDRGDDTQARFRYQNSCACFISINMLSDACSYKEVFCEQHEDILLKLKDGRFAGIQIKTREADLGALSIKDESVVKSLKRFFFLETKFPDQFSYYIISSNVGFIKSDSSGVKELIMAAKSDKIDINKRSNFTFLIKSITKEASNELNRNITCSEVINVIKKVRVRGEMPQINDIEDKITSMLSQNVELANTYIRVLKKIVDDIILLHYRASSLKMSDSAYEYYVFENKEDIQKDELVIESKKVTKKHIAKIISENIINQNLIKPATGKSSLDFTPSTVKLEKKLDAGNINVENINLMKDDKYAFETLMTERFYKDEINSINEYNHLRQIVLSECQDSYDRFDKKSLFGMDMLINVKDRIKERFKYDKKNLLDCTPEHLLGLVAILTEECQVWWSDKFEI